MGDRLRTAVSTQLAKSGIAGYCEPFCGGLGSFVEVAETLHAKGIKSIVLNDINSSLINTYQFILKDPHLLISEAKKLEDKFVALFPKVTADTDLLNNKKLKRASEFYIKTRVKFNKVKGSNSIEEAGLFLFLMSHSFNGIYRENASGGFNSPFNWRQKETDFAVVLEYHAFFNQFDISFTNMPWVDTFENSDYLFYFDPPYLNAIQAGENAYSKGGFGLRDQVELVSKICTTLKHFLYSNHDMPILRNTFKEKAQGNFKIDQFGRNNVISSKASSRSDVKKEVLVAGFKS